MVYLDNSATTRPRKEVVDAVADYSYENFGNPSSLHRMGLNAEKDMKKFRKGIADIIKADPSEIYFTAGGTESNNIAVHGIVSRFKNRKAHIICSAIEHPSILNIFKHYGFTDNIDVDYLEVDSDGIVNLEKLEELIRDDTALVSIMLVNNETGTIQPAEEISRIIRKKNSETVFHSDCVQAFGKIDIDVKKLDIDMISVSSHKIYAPKGSGALYIRKGLTVNPPFQGGGQERDIRPGTENTPGIFGFAKAAEIMEERKDEERKRMKEIKEYALGRIEKEIEDVKINSPMGDKHIDNILNISISGIKAEILLHTLEEKEIYLSTGSACSSKSKDKSHVLKAIGLSEKEIDGSVRISFSHSDTKEEIDYFIDELKEAVEDIRSILAL